MIVVLLVAMIVSCYGSVLSFIIIIEYQHSNSSIDSRFGRLPRQGSSFESVIDHNDESSILIPSVPFRHVPSPSSANSTNNMDNTTCINNLSIQAQSILIVNNSPSSSRSSSPQCISPTVLDSSTSNVKCNSDVSGTSSVECSNDVDTSDGGDTRCRNDVATSNPKSSTIVSTSNVKCSSDVCMSIDKCNNDGSGNDSLIKQEHQFHMDCQLINNMTKQVIRSSQTSQANVTAPIYRDIRIKKVTKYTTIPPLTPLTVVITVNQLCYLYVINIGSSGNVSTLIPNEFDNNNEAKPEQTIQFPPDGAEYELELDNNSGTEIVIVLGYSKRVTVEHAENDCERIRNNNRAVVERDITIKKKNVVVPIGTVEMQFSVHHV